MVQLLLNVYTCGILHAIYHHSATSKHLVHMPPVYHIYLHVLHAAHNICRWCSLHRIQCTLAYILRTIVIHLTSSSSVTHTIHLVPSVRSMHSTGAARVLQYMHLLQSSH
jgi:hypothetical protein